jgi:uncharacterized protein (DUF849 family)
MVLWKACLNGARLPAEHPALPVTAAALARDTVQVAAAGAHAVHLHVKDDDGADTLDGPRLAAVLTEVRAAAPGLPIGVTTGAWALPDPGERLAAIRSWTTVPDFASVNWHETGADDVAGALLEHGIGVEAGLWHADAVDAWLTSPHRDRCVRVLLELADGFDARDIPLEADLLLRRVRDGGAEGVPVVLHGQDGSCWPALRHALLRGLGVRIGLEDVLVLPDGSVAPDNASLMRAARALLPDPLDPAEPQAT